MYLSLETFLLYRLSYWKVEFLHCPQDSMVDWSNIVATVSHELWLYLTGKQGTNNLC